MTSTAAKKATPAEAIERSKAPGERVDVRAAHVESSAEPFSDNGGVLERGLSIIKTLSEARRPMSLTAIAEAISMDPSTVHRLLKTLIRHDYAIKDANSRKYLPGTALLHSVGLFHPLQELRRDAQPIMQDLSLRTGLTSAVILFLGDRRMVLDMRHGADRLTPYYSANHTRPLNATAVGKIYLSGMTASQAQAALGPEPYPRLTPRTITTWKELEPDLAAAHQRGYAMVLDEGFVGLAGFAAPLRFANERRMLGALVAFGSSRNLDEARTKQIAVDIVNLAGMLGLLAASLSSLSELVGPERLR